ncbi:MAG TPA: threonine synthase [Myxococcaceae bacterium]|nr:threonine synthase [Myxococcaceae bacterium]
MVTQRLETGSTLSHLQCSACGRTHDADRLQNLCPDCGKVLLARYDLERAARTLSRESVAARARGMWRWRELLPVRDERNVVSLGEGDTPLLPVPRLGARAGLSRLLLKDEGTNPTGSFKARGIAAAVSRARELGARDVALPTAGNAGGALAAYAARAGLGAHVYMPVDAPELNRKESAVYGAEVVLVRGLINDCGAWVKRRAAEAGWFDLSTLKEPYRAEGKKTMGLELAEQLGWEVPDVIVYPTGGGTGLVGIWKALDELEQLGWIGSRRPRMVAVQTEGCAPIVRAFREGLDHAPAVQGARTSISGLRVPVAVADSIMLALIRRSGGTALTVTDEEALAGMREIASTEGVYAAPEGGAVWAGIKKLVSSGLVDRDERVVLMNTGTGLKYGELVSVELPVVDRLQG